ncbi:DsbA family protein [Candidatus Woesearchaeota archaeon]|nr:DsbA family protein [Candidatus Woesearchaeota archaeon]
MAKKTKTDDKLTFLYWLIGLTLVLSVINTYNIVSLNNRFSGGTELIEEAIQAAPSGGDTVPSAPTKVDVSADDDAVKGLSNAPVTIIEFSDYQCPFCARFAEQTLSQIEQKYINTGKVKLVYRDFPLSFHANAQKAAEAAECAGDQDKYFEYHDVLFEKQSEWSNIGVSKFKEYAADLNLDQTEFDTCLDTSKHASEVQKDFADGQKAGVTGTPAFFINGVKVVGAQPYTVFEQIIENELK